ncbi:MAG: hypothetical protein VX853_01445, partial [Pseudomonadota bacterium]|nr:hypothetical protein [Pseudomonadota bacterium]
SALDCVVRAAKGSLRQPSAVVRSREHPSTAHRSPYVFDNYSPTQIFVQGKKSGAIFALAMT